jgi:hypothetical protein
MDLWKADIELETHLPSEQYLARFRANTSFVPAIEQWSPHLLEEVRGLAEGARQDFNTMIAFQCMDEDWWFREAIVHGHCSAIGITSEGNDPLLAQNMDIHSMTDGVQVLLHIRHAGFESYVFSFAGFLGLAGMNNRPLGVCVNTLPQLNSSIDGLPVAFVVRSVLEQANLDDAVGFLHGIRHASGQNYMIGDHREIRDRECSANGAMQFGANKKILWHTNHPLASEDYRPGEKEILEGSANTDSHRRLNLLETRLNAGDINADAIKDILRTSPVCIRKEADDNFFTSGSLVMTLSSTHPSLDLAVGPPSESAYVRFTF